MIASFLWCVLLSRIYSITFKKKKDFRKPACMSSFFVFYPIRIYAQLPEVQKRKEEERRKAEYNTYRLNAQLFNKVNIYLQNLLFPFDHTQCSYKLMFLSKLMHVISCRKLLTVCWEEERLGSRRNINPNIMLLAALQLILFLCVCVCVISVEDMVVVCVIKWIEQQM